MMAQCGQRQTRINALAKTATAQMGCSANSTANKPTGGAHPTRTERDNTMNDKQKADWARIEARMARGHRRSVNYSKHTCIKCGRTISEGAYSGKNGNYKKHTKACATEAN